MAEQQQTAIVAEGLTKIFPGVHAVDRLSFDVRSGRNLWLSGSRRRRKNDNSPHARGHHAAR